MSLHTYRKVVSIVSVCLMMGALLTIGIAPEFRTAETTKTQGDK